MSETVQATGAEVTRDAIESLMHLIVNDALSYLKERNPIYYYTLVPFDITIVKGLLERGALAYTDGENVGIDWDVLEELAKRVIEGKVDYRDAVKSVALVLAHEAEHLYQGHLPRLQHSKIEDADAFNIAADTFVDIGMRERLGERNYPEKILEITGGRTVLKEDVEREIGMEVSPATTSVTELARIIASRIGRSKLLQIMQHNVIGRDVTVKPCGSCRKRTVKHGDKFARRQLRRAKNAEEWRRIIRRLVEEYKRMEKEAREKQHGLEKLGEEIQLRLRKIARWSRLLKDVLSKIIEGEEINAPSTIVSTWKKPSKYEWYYGGRLKRPGYKMVAPVIPVYVVLDTSGSMAGELEDVASAIYSALESLDLLSDFQVVFFDTDAYKTRKLYAPTPAMIKRVLSKARGYGGTEPAKALSEVLKDILSSRSTTKPIVIFASDMYFDEGPVEHLLKAIHEKARVVLVAPKKYDREVLGKLKRYADKTVVLS